MASRYFAVSRGVNFQSYVTEGSSTGSKDVELVVDLTNSPTREQVLLALEVIENHIATCNWPPA